MQLDRANTPSWIQTDMERGKWIPYNRYFMDHPEMLMGKMESSRNMYGNEDGTACIAPESFDLYEHLSDALESLSAHFSAEPDVEPIEEAEEEQPTDYEDAPRRDPEFYLCGEGRRNLLLREEQADSPALHRHEGGPHQGPVRNPYRAAGGHQHPVP